MNYTKVNRENMCYLEADSFEYHELMEQLVLDELMVFYVMKNNRIIGILDKADVISKNAPSMDKDYIRCFDKMPTSKQIQDILKTWMYKKLVIFVGDDVVCEYRNLEYGYFPRQVYRNFMSLRYVDIFGNQFADYLKASNVRQIYILCESDLTDYLRKKIEDINFIWHKKYSTIPENDNIAIWNFRYGKDYYEDIPHSLVKRFEDFYFLAERVIFKVFTDYCEKYDMQYYFVKGPVTEELTCLSYFEECNFGSGKTLQELIEDKDIVKKIAADESDLEYLDNRLLNATVALNNGFSIVESDIAVEHLHIKGGIRKTMPEMENFCNSLHLYGPCISSGYMVSDEHTIESYLQQIYAHQNINIKIFNHGTNNGQVLLCDVINALNTPAKAGDTFVFIFEQDPILDELGIPVYNLNPVFNQRKHKNEIFFYDCPAHCNKFANSLMAEYLFSLREEEKVVCESSEKTYFELMDIDIFQFEYYDVVNPNLLSFYLRYSALRRELSKYEKIGGMLIHAAPFTKGHKYLIDTALLEMDAVVVFVMADYFHSLSVLDRVEIVRENMKAYSNVYVVPIEPFAISSSYFPAYMYRDNKMFESNKTLKFTGEMVDKYTFSYFGIKYRFLGEEESGSFTDKYNDLVSEEAPKHGITVSIIRRKLDDCGAVISAGTARRAIADKDVSTMKRILPDETINYILKNDVVLHQK